MKDKKRVILIVLSLLILFVAITLVIILTLGGIAKKKENEYHHALETAAYKYARDYNITADIISAFPDKAIINLKTLVDLEYVKKSLTNEVKKINVYDDNGYVLISWTNNQMICIYKEG